MLGNIEAGVEERSRDKMVRCSDLRHLNLSNQEIEEDKGAWHAVVHRVHEDWT